MSVRATQDQSLWPLVCPKSLKACSHMADWWCKWQNQFKLVWMSERTLSTHGYRTLPILRDVISDCFVFRFSKAFDHASGTTYWYWKITVVHQESASLIISFLSCCRQRVKLSTLISDWLPVTAGVPQATKLGPISFLVMANNLQYPSKRQRTRNRPEKFDSNHHSFKVNECLLNVPRHRVNQRQYTLKINQGKLK